MKYVGEDENYINGKCEKCRSDLAVPKANTIPIADGFDLKNTIKCKCGNIHNLILGNVNTQKWAKEKVKFDPNYMPPSPHSKNEPLSCPVCKATQLYASDKGFSLLNAAAGGILFGPVGLLGGVLGSKRTIITCLRCGHKWEAGR